MDFNLEEALQQFPLPEGVEDATLTLTELADALELTEPTIKRYIRAGMPVVAEGGNGRQYELSLSECFAWKLWRDQQEELDRQKRSKAIGQMRLAFRNEGSEEGTTTLTAKEISEESQAELHRLKAAQARGDLIPTDRVRETIERALVGFRNSLVTFPDYCEIEFGLSPDDVAKMENRVDGILNELELTLSDGLRPEGEVKSLHA